MKLQSKNLLPKSEREETKQTEGKEREREKKEMTQWIRALCKHKEPSVHVKAKHSCGLQYLQHHQSKDRIAGRQTSTSFSKSLCLKGIQWQVIAQNTQSPPEPPPRMHVYSWWETGSQRKSSTSGTLRYKLHPSPVNHLLDI